MNQTIKTLYQLSDNSFDSNHLNDYNLSILLSGDGFSYVVGQGQPLRIIELGSFEFIIPHNGSRILKDEQILNLFSVFVMNHPWLSKPMGRSNVWIENRYATLVPEALYDKNSLNDYLSFNTQIPQNYIQKSDYLPSVDAWNVFALPNEWEKQISLLFPSASIHHASSSFIELIIAQSRIYSSPELVFIYPHRFYFELAYLVQSKLIFYNSFSYSTQEDFIYFVLFSLEQLSLNPEIISICLMGEIDAGSPLHLILTNYLRNVNFASRDNNVVYTYIFDQIPSHYFLTIIHSLQCEL